MSHETPTNDPIYAVLLELERLEALREDLLDDESDALADLQAIGLTSLDDLSERIDALHRQVDQLG